MRKYWLFLFLFLFCVGLVTAAPPRLEPGGRIIITTGSGTTNFLGLTDTPSAYTGANDNCLIVNETAGTVYFGGCSTGSGTVTSVTRGFGLNNNATSITTSGDITVNTTLIQRRVSGTCGAGSSIRVVNQDGTVTCETDNDSANTTFNETYTNTLYAGISFNYNASLAVPNNSLFLSIFNITGFVYNYNQSTPYDAFNYNMTDGVGSGNTTFNESYTNTLYAGIEWDYNQTGAGSEAADDSILLNIDNITNFAYNYNQTIDSDFDYNMTIETADNSILSHIDNITNFAYNYNQTGAASEAADNSILLHIDNVTNFDYNYNQTIDSAFDYNMTITDETADNSILLDIDNVTNFNFNYNQTGAASEAADNSILLTTANISDLYNYSLFVPDNSLILSILNISGFSFNYNQSTPYDAYNYNMTIGTGDSYNYSLFAPNDSLFLHIDNVTSFDYNYNQSSPYDTFNYNMSDGTGGNSTFNESYTNTLYAGIEWGYNLSANVRLNDVLNPTASKTFTFSENSLEFLFTNPTSNGFSIEASGAFAGDLIHVHQHTGNPGNVNLLALEADDPDVLALNVSGAMDNVAWFDGNVLVQDGVYSNYNNITGNLVQGGATTVWNGSCENKYIGGVLSWSSCMA